MQARKENVLTQYEMLVSDYENRTARIKRAKVKGKNTAYDKQLLESFEKNLQSLKPQLAEKIMNLELLLGRN